MQSKGEAATCMRNVERQDMYGVADARCPKVQNRKFSGTCGSRGRCPMPSRRPRNEALKAVESHAVALVVFVQEPNVAGFKAGDICRALSIMGACPDFVACLGPLLRGIPSIWRGPRVGTFQTRAHENDVGSQPCP